MKTMIKVKNITLVLLLLALPCFSYSGDFKPNPQIGFSPEGSARDLVITFINEAKYSLDIMAYGWTARDITKAVADAARRGVKVRLVADYKANTVEDRYGSAQRALSSLVEAGVDVRLNSRYSIHHDKNLLADGVNIETGSFNFTAQAETHNSEQVLVLRGAPQAYKALEEHFLSRFEAGEEYH